MTVDLPPPPPIHRPYTGEDAGFIGQPFTSSDQLIAQMPSFLRTYFANKKIERPNVFPADHAAGAYSPVGGRVLVARDSPYPEDDNALHELLHALNFEHPAYASEPMTGYPRLKNALSQSGYPPETVMAPNVDWQHTFTNFGQMAGRDPYRLTVPLQNYFAPLLPPVDQMAKGPR
jgi:hypothetical protein